MNLTKLINNYEKLGISNLDAIAKVCGEVVLSKISKTSIIKNITIKGGFVMMNISNDVRRTTRDLDIDFIKYSLTENNIEKFISNLNQARDEVFLSILYPIENLKHQDYSGKRVNLLIEDKYDNNYKFKLDIGVHKNVKLQQQILIFDLNSISRTICLFANSKEQIMVEKLKSLLKFGYDTSRIKDIFDIYYLIVEDPVNETKIINIIKDYIISDKLMWEKSFFDIYYRLLDTLENTVFIKKLVTAKDNWLELPVDDVKNTILIFFENLVLIPTY